MQPIRMRTVWAFMQRIDVYKRQGYEKDVFTVYHRLYDVLNITVVSSKDTVGYFDMESEVEVKEL